MNDPRLWDIFETGDEKQWEAVQDEFTKKQFDQYLTERLKKLDELEKEFPKDFVALLLSVESSKDHATPMPVLISQTDTELNSVLQASGQFEVVRDRSKLGPLQPGEYFGFGVFLRATRRSGEWRFEYPDSSPGTIGRGFLEGVAGRIKKLLQANAGKESQPS